MTVRTRELDTPATSGTRILLGVSVVFASLSFMFLALSLSAPVPEFWGFRGSNALIGVVSAWLGYTIARRHAHNPIGWSFMAIGVAASIDGAAVEYATYGLFGPGGVPAPAVGAWMHDWIWLTYVVFITIVFLYFPDGRLPSLRLRPLVGLVSASGALVALLLAFTPGPLTTFGIPNPFGLDLFVPFSAPSKTSTLAGVGFVGLGISVATAAISLVRRFLRSTGDTRQQLKWFAVSAIVVAIALLSSFVWNGVKLTQIATVGAFLAAEAAIAVAILRYHLYEIDTLINRAIVYGALTAVLTGVFAASQEVLKRIFVAATGQSSDAAVVVALFIIATLFAPMRARLQKIVDTRFKSAQAQAAVERVGTVDLLRECARLHAEGVLTNEEFAEKKRELLARL